MCASTRRVPYTARCVYSFFTPCITRAVCTGPAQTSPWSQIARSDRVSSLCGRSPPSTTHQRSGTPTLQCRGGACWRERERGGTLSAGEHRVEGGRPGSDPKLLSFAPARDSGLSRPPKIQRALAHTKPPHRVLNEPVHVGQSRAIESHPDTITTILSPSPLPHLSLRCSCTQFRVENACSSTLLCFSDISHFGDLPSFPFCRIFPTFDTHMQPRHLSTQQVESNQRQVQQESTTTQASTRTVVSPLGCRCVLNEPEER